MQSQCRSYAPSSARPFKRQASYEEGPFIRQTTCRRSQSNDLSTLVGTSNEVSVHVHGIETLALLDTGSTVTTIGREFYDRYLAVGLPIHPLNDILMVECADGNKLPYDGYIELDINVSGLPTGQSQSCLALVVPKSAYNSRVPLLIGTNLLSTFLTACKEEYGERLLQTAGLFTPWYLSFRCMLLWDKELRRHHTFWVMCGVPRPVVSSHRTLLVRFLSLYIMVWNMSQPLQSYRKRLIRC